MIQGIVRMLLEWVVATGHSPRDLTHAHVWHS